MELGRSYGGRMHEMDQRALAPSVIVGIVVVVAVAVGVGVVYVLGGLGGGPGGENIGSATSIDFKMDMTIAGGTSTTRFMAKDIGSSNMKLRVETTAAGLEAKLILNIGNQEAWIWSSASGWENWKNDSANFELYRNTYETQLSDSLDVLSGWTGGDYNYTDPTSGTSLRFYDIQMNPALSDTLFQPS